MSINFDHGGYARQYSQEIEELRSSLEEKEQLVQYMVTLVYYRFNGYILTADKTPGRGAKTSKLFYS